MPVYYEEGPGRIYIGGGIWQDEPSRTPGGTTTIIPPVSSFPTGTPISLPPREILNRASTAIQRQANVSAVNEPCRVVLGTDRLGAQLLNGLLTVPDIGDLLMIVVWCRGPISAINSVTMNDKPLPSTVTATHYLGTLSQTVDATLVSAFATLGITHTYAFPGIAYSVFRIPSIENVGEFHCIPDGVKAYDIRDGSHVLATPSTWTFTANPALLLAHMISDTTYGLGGSMDWSGSVAAFNACEAITTGEAKRLIGYTLDRRMKASEVCEILRAHAGCFIVRSAGKYKLIPDAVASSVATFAKSTSTLVEKSIRWQLAGLEQQPNVVEVSYTDTSVIPWKSSIAVYPANGVPPAGEELRLTRIDLHGCQRYSQAMREVVERRNHARLEPLTITCDTFAESLSVEPGDVYTINDGGAFTGTQLRCMGRSMRRKGRFTLVGKKYDPATYSSAADATPTFVNTNLPDPFGDPPAVTAITLDELAITSESSTTPLSQLDIGWAPSLWPYMSGYRVEVRREGIPETVVYSAFVEKVGLQTPPLPSPGRYGVYIAPISSTGKTGPSAYKSISAINVSGQFADVWSMPLTSSGWTVYASVVQTGLVFEAGTVASLPDTHQVYHGQIMAPDMVISPIWDLGLEMTVTFALDALAYWAEAYRGKFLCSLLLYDEAGNNTAEVSLDSRATQCRCRYVALRFVGIVESTYTGVFPIYGENRWDWKIDLTGATLVASMPVQSERANVTSSASGTQTLALANRYINYGQPLNVQYTVESTTVVQTAYNGVVIGELQPNALNVDCYDGSNARIAKPGSVVVSGVRGDKTRTNWAAAANGATASASSATAGFPASQAINGDLSTWGSGAGGWNSTGAQPQNLQVDFVGSKAITEIVVVTLRDSFGTPNVPTVFDTFTLYGITAFTIEYWTGSAWAAVAGGTVTGNNKVMRRFPVSITATKVRCVVTASVDGVTRIVELLAIGPA